ncbi:MAG: metal ABC transporter ATP-binding protein [Planctomycetota bacterium]|nr:MAG: metal ABC transporter ATP-binding protein [Planctomycetota bacterium]
MPEHAVQLDRVSFAYPARGLRDQPVQALRDISMAVPVGSRLGVLGPNGGGKSTLVKLILGLIEPDTGSITVLGTTPADARRRGLIGYLPQRLTAELDFPISVRQAVAMPLALRAGRFRLRDRAAETAADESLALVGMTDLANRPIGALSGGQLQRAMIARAIATRPRLLVLDEPTVGVDAAGQHRFADLINKLHAELGITIITVSHDLRAIAAGSDRVACLHRSVHFHDAPSGLTPAILAEVFAHDVQAVFGHLHIDAHAAADCDDPTHAPPTTEQAAGSGCCNHHDPKKEGNA